MCTVLLRQHLFYGCRLLFFRSNMCVHVLVCVEMIRAAFFSAASGILHDEL